MKAVIYARYSSDNQREESIEGQIRECTAFAEKNDITVLKHYIDRAYSARTDHRPAFQEMIKDSDKHLFDMVIVWKLDRFSRDRYDSARYRCCSRRTTSVSFPQPGDFFRRRRHPTGIRPGGFAEYYSADLAEKVARGLTENALKGKCNGGTRPVGYVVDDEQHFQIDPLTGPFVLEAFKRYDDGATMKEVVEFLGKGIKNSLGRDMNLNSVSGCFPIVDIWANTPSEISLFPMQVPAIVRKSCSTEYRKRWQKIRKPLPDIRQRMIIC